MNYQEILHRIYHETKHFANHGKVASYIPALANVPPELYGISIACLDKKRFSVGDHAVPFSIQSISKVFTFTLAYSILGDKIWERIDREPSGNAFNSLVQLEHENGIPRNPFINAGAIVVADILLSHFDDPAKVLLDFVREQADDNNIFYDAEVARSEKETGHRNYALAHFMKSFGNIHNPVENVLDLYFHQCSMVMTTDQLACSMLFLANHGTNPHNGNKVLNISQSKRLKALLLTSGMYNESGDFAFRVGMSGKSGVGGGIVAVIPQLLSMAVWSPPLNERGNSVAGFEAMELFTTYTGKSVF